MRLQAELHKGSISIRDVHVFKAMNDGINLITLGFESEVKKTITRKGLVDTGRLRSSMMSEVNNLSGRVGTNVKYARIHEYGGIIRPKKGKYLVFQVTRSNRIMSLNGSKRLKRAVAQKGWVRVKEVKIREKRYFRDSIDTFNPKMKRILQNVVSDAALRMSGGGS